MIHQDCTTSRTQERERERDQTHSYWYIPSASRENYSLLVMESTGMMKMATGEGSPLWQGAGTGLDWFSVATEACGGGTPDLSYVLEVSIFIGFFGIGITSRRCPSHPRGRPTRPGVGVEARPPPSWAPCGSPD